MTPVEILRAAHELIADPAHWCQSSMARMADGSPCDALSPHAVSWCALGACPRVAGTEKSYELEKAFYFIGLASTNSISVNDELGHAAVMKMYDRAIELAESAK